jgi:hypothetical protein
MENCQSRCEAYEVSVEDGSVLIRGPDSLTVTLSRKAALELSDRLFGQAMRARGSNFVCGIEVDCASSVLR